MQCYQIFCLGVSMSISRSGWERLAELWSISEIATVLPRASMSLQIIGMCMHSCEVDVYELVQDIAKCKNFLQGILKDLGLCVTGEASEAELVALLMERQVQMQSVESAMHGIEKVFEAAKNRTLNGDTLRDKDVTNLDKAFRGVCNVSRAENLCKG